MSEPRMRWLSQAPEFGSSKFRLGDIETFVRQAKRRGFTHEAEVDFEYDMAFMADRITVKEIER